MPIGEASPDKCFDTFLAHVRRVLAAVLGPSAAAAFGAMRGPDSSRMIAAFRQGPRPITIPLSTANGQLHFYMGQSLEAASENTMKRKAWRLSTQAYWYRLQLADGVDESAAMRWEYVRAARADAYARHHIQFPATMRMPRGKWDFDKLHLPSGYVLFEEILRFLVVDLGVKPACGETWPGVLTSSERAFFEDFTGKRYKAPAK